MKPKISIVVPIYNTEKYLGKCIKSILNQSYENFELILVNDGSTDNSEEICEYAKKKDERIIYIRQENKGAAFARNTGINAAKGKYLVFIDSDDIIDKDFINILLNYKNKYSSELVACEFTNIYREKREKHTRNSFDKSFIKKGELVKEFLTSKIFNNDNKQKLTNVVCKLFVTEIIKSNNITFKNNICEYEDSLFLLEYYQYVSVFVYIHKSLYNRTWRTDSLVNSYKPNILEDLHNTLIEYEKLKKKYNISCHSEDMFVLDMVQIIIGKNLFREENDEAFVTKNQKLYSFLKTSLVKSKWQSLDLKKIKDKKILAKALLIKSHLIVLWYIASKLKKFII